MLKNIEIIIIFVILLYINTSGYRLYGNSDSVLKKYNRIAIKGLENKNMILIS
jgi:hypothetical protein